MTNDHHSRPKALAQPMGRRPRPLLQRLTRRRAGPFLEFDALAAYLGLLIGVGLGAASPTAVPLVANTAAQLCVVGALEVGRNGIAECLPP